MPSAPSGTSSVPLRFLRFWHFVRRQDHRDLLDALSAPNDTMVFVESIMDRYDALAPVMNSSNKGADLDYGPRGPQRSDNQLRPAM